MYLIEKMENINFKSQDEIFNYVNHNAEYLQLLKNSDDTTYTIEPTYYKNPNRYLLSKDNIFIIDTMAVKCFEEGEITAPVSHIEELKKIKSFDEHEYYGENSAFQTIVYGYQEDMIDSKEDDSDRDKLTSTEIIQRTTSGKNRVKMSLSSFVRFDAARIDVTVRPYKRTLGVWYWCTRTINVQVEWIEALALYNNFATGTRESMHLAEVMQTKFEEKTTKFSKSMCSLPCSSEIQPIKIEMYRVDATFGSLDAPQKSFIYDNLSY